MSNSRDAGGRMHRDAANIVVNDLAFSGMQSGSDLNSERSNAVGDAAGAAHAARRTIECGQHTVPSRAYLQAAKTRQLAAYDPVKALQKVAPAAVTERRRPVRRADDIGKENGRKDSIRLPAVALPGEKFFDLIEDRVHVGTIWQMVLARKLYELRAGNPVGQEARTSHMRHKVANGIQDQRGNMDGRQDMANVDLEIHAGHRQCRTGARCHAQVPRPPLPKAVVEGEAWRESIESDRPSPVLPDRVEHLFLLFHRAPPWVVRSKLPPGEGADCDQRRGPCGVRR